MTQKPQDLQTRVSLAAGYMVAGNRTKAIATLQDMKTLTTDKGALAQIDSLIKDIQNGKNPFETTTQ